MSKKCRLNRDEQSLKFNGQDKGARRKKQRKNKKEKGVRQKHQVEPPFMQDYINKFMKGKGDVQVPQYPSTLCPS